MTKPLCIEGPLSRHTDWNVTTFEFMVTYESGSVLRWTLEFTHSNRKFSLRKAGDFFAVNPKMMLALGHRPIDIPDGSLRDHLRSLLPPADLAACLAAALSE